jgi:integral membrane protein
MRAGGLTKGKILLPFLLVAGLLSFSVYHLNQNLIPHSNKEFKRKVNYLTSSGLLAGIKPGQFFNLIPGVTLFATQSTKYGRNLDEVFLQLNDMNLIKFFRWVALAEGVSFIILLGIAMPLKYLYDSPDAVRFFGMAHGLLFVGFVMLAFNYMNSCNKNFWWLMKAVGLSLIPFGTFYLDRELRRN